MSLVEAEVRDPNPKGFSVVSPDKTYILRFESTNEKTEWHNTIVAAISGKSTSSNTSCNPFRILLPKGYWKFRFSTGLPLL